MRVQIEKITAEIEALKASAAPGTVASPSPKRDSLEEKLDRILKRLDAIEKRLDHSEKSTQKPDIEQALKENGAYKAMTSHVADLQRSLFQAEHIHVDKNHPKLQEARDKVKQAEGELRELRKKLIPEIRQQLREYYDLVR